jgi:hypothetical protein
VAPGAHLNLFREKKAIANAPFTEGGVKETTPKIMIDNVKDPLAVSAGMIDSAEHEFAQLALDGVSLVVVEAILFGFGVFFEMRANPDLHDDGHSGLKQRRVKRSRLEGMMKQLQ